MSAIRRGLVGARNNGGRPASDEVEVDDGIARQGADHHGVVRALDRQRGARGGAARDGGDARQDASSCVDAGS
jgi:hypothetical protein